MKSTLVTLFALTLASAFLVQACALFYPGNLPIDDNKHNEFGPMTQTLEIIPYESQAAEYDSYKACNIDFMDSPLTSNQIGELSTIDPFMSTYARAPYVEAGMFEFDLNNAKSPTNETVF